MLYTREPVEEGDIKDRTVVQPVDAATVILVRDDVQKPFEIFLMRRHKNQSFMAGAFVFPGGRLDKTDQDSRLHAVSAYIFTENGPRTLNEPDLPDHVALGLYFAAVRETFEESRILLATSVDGNPAHLNDQNHIDRLEAYRKQIHHQDLSLFRLAEMENLRYSLDLLVPYSRWITPEIERKRFDTRFFLAKMPKGLRPIHDAIEMTESLWLTPAEALHRQDAGRLPLMPPTVKTIDELTAYSSLNHLFASIDTGKIEPILPQAVPTEKGFILLLPHDPEYTLSPVKPPPGPGDPSRIVMVDGKWKPVLYQGG